MCRGLGTEVQGHEDGPGKDRGWCSEDGIGAASSKVTQQEAAHIGLFGRTGACMHLPQAGVSQRTCGGVGWGEGIMCSVHTGFTPTW